MDGFQELLGQIKDLQRRMSALESYDQLRKAIFRDNSSIPRILIDGVNGALKISTSGNNVLTATNAQLLFSTDFGAIVESRYALLAERNYNNNTTNWWYAGPPNGVTNIADPVLIQVNSTDYKNILFYLEANMSGAGPALCEAQLYCVTNSTAVPGSVIDSVAGSTAVMVRSSALTLFNGNNQYAVQYRRVGGTTSNYPDLVEAHLVTRVSI